jgi:hypothetical protein
VGTLARFEGEFFRLCKQRALHALLTFTEAGIALGATLLAPLRRSASGVETLDLSGEDRILAAFTAAFLAPVDAALLGKLRRACDLWARGDKSLAQIYLAGLRLPPIDEEQALRLHLADRLMASGYSPRELCKQLGFVLPAGLRKFDPDQPRDGHGRWTAGGGGSSGSPQTVTEGRSISPGGPRGGEESEDDKIDAERRALGEETPEEDRRHGRPIDPLGPTPVPFGGTRPAGDPRYTAAGNNYSLKQGQQDKHIEGTNSFRPDRGIFADPDPQGLLDRFAGTGQPANAIPPGRLGTRNESILEG